MNTLVLYTLTVLIWGSTWLVILFQLGSVPEEVSVAYRFGISAVIMFVFCWLTKKSLRFSVKQHVQAAMLGVCLFAVNYYFFYLTENYINSALTAIGFSTMLIFNVVNARLWFKTAITPSVVLGSVVGLTGITVLFWPQLADVTFGQQTLIGLGLCLLGTLSASIGNMISLKNKELAMPLLPTNAWGMAYGAAFMTLFALIQGKSLVIDWSAEYLIALLYLSVFGSVIAFACYLTLLNRIGAHKASYSTVMFPVVAVFLSTVFENFQWSTYTVVGLLLIFAGNLTLILKPKVALPKQQKMA